MKLSKIWLVTLLTAVGCDVESSSGTTTTSWNGEVPVDSVVEGDGGTGSSGQSSTARPLICSLITSGPMVTFCPSYAQTWDCAGSKLPPHGTGAFTQPNAVHPNLWCVFGPFGL